MISKIKKIKNLGIFSDFKWPDTLKNFRRFNLIYGWNGSGKTTLSKLFFGLEVGKLNEYGSLEYEIETVEGENFKHGQEFNKKIRVFNQDYVFNNVFPQEKKAKLIYILGEENKQLAEQIERDEKEILKKKDELRLSEKNKAEKETERGKKFTDIAALISINLAGFTSRTYRKPDAEQKFNSLKEKDLLNKENLKKYMTILRQEEKPQIGLLRLPEVNLPGESILNIDSSIKLLINSANKLFGQTVESNVIERIKENSDISNWVEEGIILHDKHKSKICEFCNQPIPEARLSNLAKHFNDEDKRLKSSIDKLVEHLRIIYSSIEKIKTIDKANLYEELRDNYTLEVDNFENDKKELLILISNFGNKLKDKKLHTTESVSMQNEIDVDPLMLGVDKINKILSNHNKKCLNLKTEKEGAHEKLEIHYLSTIFDDVKSIEKDIQKLIDESKILVNGDPKNLDNIGITKLKQRVDEGKIKISSAHKACAEINENLQAFIGSDELTFEAEKEGYSIKRHGEIASNLSEGEKTAIAFTYFTIHLKDKDFDIKNGIVIIDDPISSLDSSILFRVGSFIQMKLRNVGQLFILTHNYDFFNQTKKWFYNDLNREPDETKHTGTFFMIKNYADSTTSRRAASLNELDPLLRDYESEYHFLFSKLYSFKDDVRDNERGDILTIYHYPNLARKFLECFLSFKVPKRGNFYTRFMALKELNKEILGTDLSEAYNFVNSHSHLDTKTGLIQFDPTLTLSGDKCIELVLKITKQADEQHYKAMEKAIRIVD